MALSETAKVPNGSPTPTPETPKCQVQALRRSALRRDTHLSVFSRLTRNVGKHHASIPDCRQPQHQTPHRMQGRTLRCHRHRFKVSAASESGNRHRLAPRVAHQPIPRPIPPTNQRWAWHAKHRNWTRSVARIAGNCPTLH